MPRSLFIAIVCTYVLTVCLLPEVEGASSNCLRSCKKHCRSDHVHRGRQLNPCFKACAKTAKMCEVCKGPQSCTKCKTGYKLIAGTCILACDPNCASGCTTKLYGKCDSACKKGYNLTAEFTCANIDECATATDIYVLCGDQANATGTPADCTDTVGGFICKCNAGNNPDGTCTDPCVGANCATPATSTTCSQDAGATTFTCGCSTAGVFGAKCPNIDTCNARCY